MKQYIDCFVAKYGTSIGYIMYMYGLAGFGHQGWGLLSKIHVKSHVS